MDLSPSLVLLAIKSAINFMPFMAFIAFMASGQRHHINMVLIGQGNDMQKLLTAYLSSASKDTLWCYVINVLMYCD